MPKEQPEITVDLSAWTTMEPIMRWQTGARVGDFEGMADMMAEVITAWPYQADPHDVTSYKALSPKEYKAAARAVGQAVGAFFQDETN